MTKKHYLQAVAIIKEGNYGKPYNCTEFACVVDSFARFFAADNVRFNRARFEEACFAATAKKVG